MCCEKRKNKAPHYRGAKIRNNVVSEGRIVPRRNRKDDKQGQISCLQGDKTQQKPSREVYRGPGAGIRGDTEGAFFCPE